MVEDEERWAEVVVVTVVEGAHVLKIDGYTCSFSCDSYTVLSARYFFNQTTQHDIKKTKQHFQVLKKTVYQTGATDDGWRG